MCNSAEVWRLVMERKAVRQEYSLFSLCMLNSCLFLFFFSLSLLLAHWRFLHFKRDDLFFCAVLRPYPIMYSRFLDACFFMLLGTSYEGGGLR